MQQIRDIVYRIPRYFNWPVVIGGFALLALVIMLPRWGGTIEDSQAYFDTARWLRGDAPASSLRAPFPYRIGVPALAALIPGPVRHTFALANWLFVVATACLSTATVRRLGFGTKRALVAGLLVVISLPTFWYAPYLLVDPGSVCMRMLFVFGVLTGQPGIALVAGLAATGIREENILLLVWLVVLRQVSPVRGLVALAVAGAWLVAVRWWIVPPLPHYTWVPNLGTVRALFGDWRALASLAGCGCVMVPLAIAGMRGAPEQLRPLKGLLVLMALPPLYAALSVRVEGRIVWGLYPFLAPFAVAYGLPRRVVQAPDVRALKPAGSSRQVG